MTLKEFFQDILFTIGNKDFTAGSIIITIVTLVICFILYWVVVNRLLPFYFSKERVKTKNKEQIKRIIKYLFILLAFIGSIFALKLDYVFYTNGNIDIKISTIFEALIILQIARLLDWIISKVLLFNYYRNRDEEKLPKVITPQPIKKEEPLIANRSVQYAVYVFAIILILQSFNLDYTIFSVQNQQFKISNIFWAIFIILIAQLIAWILTQLILYSYYQRQKVNVGSQYAINQLLKYVIYVIAGFMAIESLGINMTVVWGSAAALLVGVGLGLQQTFNDLISGIILLFEGTVEVGDTVQIESGLVGTVKKIGIRTSIVESRDNVTVIVPNSKLITERVVNWSHYDDKVRFNIDVGVAYGSDTELVKELLLKVAKENIYIMEYPAPFVRFTNFGGSSLDFELRFWSRNFIVIEDIKSDLRFEIDKHFREHNIVIPFPQTDVWLKK